MRSRQIYSCSSPQNLDNQSDDKLPIFEGDLGEARPAQVQLSSDWTTVAILRVPYGRAGSLDLNNTSRGPRRKVQLVVRLQRLRDG